MLSSLYSPDVLSTLRINFINSSDEDVAVVVTGLLISVEGAARVVVFKR